MSDQSKSGLSDGQGVALDNLSRRSYDDDEDDDERGVTSSGSTLTVGAGGTASSTVTAPGGYVASGPGHVYADGMENGLVGASNDSNRENLLRTLVLDRIKDPAHAVPIIAHEGEAILNRNQQALLLENFGNAWNYGVNFAVPSYKFKNISSGGGDVKIDKIDIKIEKCDNPDQLATAVKKGIFASALRQELGRR